MFFVFRDFIILYTFDIYQDQASSWQVSFKKKR